MASSIASVAKRTCTHCPDLRKFVVKGEQHYLVHVAIGRFTGQVLDKQIEVVNE
jgi:hypothetical protein